MQITGEEESMTARATRLSAEIADHLAGLRKTVDDLDPDGVRSDLRVYLAYALRLAVNTEILKRDPADMELVRNKVIEIAAFPQRVNYRVRGSDRQHADETALAKTAKLYGIAWSVFDHNRFLQNADLFRRRFVANGIDLDFVKGADCLDFGCGTGRNCLALARLGAGSVLGVDLSEGCISTARSNLERYAEWERIELLQANLFEHFAGKEELFDFVVAQGVLMTMPSPDDALKLVHQILRPGGRFFVYFFGESENGIIWEVARTYRHLLKPVPMELTRDILISLNANQGDIFNLLDFAYVPNQHHWPRARFEESLRKAGFSKITPMLRGENYDAHQRILDYPWEREFWGDFDLRYMLVR